MDIDTLPNPETLTRAPGAPSMGTDEVSPEEALAEIKAQKEAAERDRDAERARATQLQRENEATHAKLAEAGTREVSAREQAVDTAIKSHELAASNAKAAIASATSSGDAVALSEAIDALTEAKSNLKLLGQQKEWLESQKGRQPEVRQQPQDSRLRVKTPGGEMPVAPAAKDWMDAHPRFYNDPAYYNHAVVAHGIIVEDGIQEGTPAYFRELDARMTKFEQFEAFERGEHQQKETTPMNNGQQRRMPASAMGAPVSRQTTPQNYNRGGQVDPSTIARHFGCDVGDLKEFARINGYTKQRYQGDENAAFAAYLKDQQEIIDIERSGGDTGMRVDGVYR